MRVTHVMYLGVERRTLVLSRVPKNRATPAILCTLLFIYTDSVMHYLNWLGAQRYLNIYASDSLSEFLLTYL